MTPSEFEMNEVLTLVKTNGFDDDQGCIVVTFFLPRLIDILPPQGIDW